MGDLILFPTVQKAFLYALGLDIPIHPGLKFIDHEEVEFPDNPEVEGNCTSQYNAGKISIELAINSLLLEPKKTFVRGHEEGHAIFYLGHLTSLKKVADDLGVGLDFFNDNYCSIHDEATRKFLTPNERTAVDYVIARNKPYYEKEMIAHLGGLVALINSKANPKTIEQVNKAIQEGNLRPYPDAEIIELK